ncbi:MAG: hypothetical protein U0R24_11005 [Solirubrobacterales bacterium]
MSWLTDLVDRIDAKLDRPADQTALTDPRKRRSMRMLDQMKAEGERAERGEPRSGPGAERRGEPADEPPKVRGGAGEKNARQRWLRW